MTISVEGGLWGGAYHTGMHTSSIADGLIVLVMVAAAIVIRLR